MARCWHTLGLLPADGTALICMHLAAAHCDQVLRALGLLSPDDIAALEALAGEVEQYKASVQEEEEAFEDIPGELSGQT